MTHDSYAGWHVAPKGKQHVSRTAARGPSVGDVVDEFLEAVDEGFARDRYGRPFAAESARELHWSLGTYLGEHLGAIPVADLRRDHVEALIFELGNAGISRRRLRALVKSVRALYDYAAERDLVRHNPAERVAIPDEDDAGQPAAGQARRGEASPTTGIFDRAISLTLRLATLGFVLVALILLTQSL
jgi:hypothetical protein